MSAQASDQAAFDGIVALASPELQRVCVELRRLVLSVHPEATQSCWPRLKIASFGVGPKKNVQHYAYIAVHQRHVNLGFYHGASLQGEAVGLQGTGRNLRHVKVDSIATVRTRAIRALLRAALRERLPYRQPD